MKVFSKVFLVLVISSLLVFPAQAKAEGRSLTFGVGPYYSLEKMVSGFEPLLILLSGKMGQEVQLKYFDSYAEVEERIQKGDIDLALIGPGAYVKLKQRYPRLKYLVTTQSTKNGVRRASYLSYIITHKTSGLKKLEDMTGKGFAFVSKESSSGYKYPLSYFKKHKLDPWSYFSQVIFTGSHASVTNKIAHGEIDAGATWDANLWAAEKEYGEVFNIIAEIGPIPTLAVVANHRLDDKTCQNISNHLETLPRAIFTTDMYFTGFEKLDDSFYDPVRDVILSQD